MSLDNFQEQIEVEREWREAEIRFLDNTQRSIDNDADKKMIRRSILCLIYAHIEGFVKFSFSLYIEEINKKNLFCKDVKPVIAAAAFSKELMALKDTSKKSNLFRKKLPNDTHLHRLCRDTEFFENIENFFNHIVKIPEDYVNTENNVGTEVLEKLLFQVGLQHEDLKDIYAPLSRLLNARNDISHGKRKHGIDDRDYEEFLNCARSIITSISHHLTIAYGNSHYLKAA